jgi:hypothetical protein
MGSGLVDDMVCEMGVGGMSASKARRFAEKSLVDARRSGATRDLPATAGLASAGTFGRHPGNIDRDARRFFARTRKEMGMEIEPYETEILMKKHRGYGTELRKHWVLLPHELFHQLHKQGSQFQIQQPLNNISSNASFHNWCVGVLSARTSKPCCLSYF